jgi:tetratricopeptide (TPR) repeat protein
MTRETWSLLLSLGMAVVIPVVVLDFATPEERSSLDLVVSPFGKLRLLVIHLVFALPMALAVSRTVPQFGNAKQRSAVAAVLTLALVFFLPSFAEQLTSASAGPTIRVIARSIVSLALVLPWMIVFASSASISRWQWLGATMALFAPPAAFSQQLQENNQEEFLTLSETGRTQRAYATLQLLIDLGSAPPKGKKSLVDISMRMKRELEMLNKSVSRELPPSSSKEVKLSYITAYLELNRIKDAEQILQNMPQDDLTVRMLTSAVLREQARWAEFIPVAEQLTKELPHEAAMYENLGEAYQKLNRSADALEVYRRAEEAIPKKAGAFQLKQGLVCADRGQSERAKAHFEKAVTLDPSLATVVDGPMRRLKSETFSCLSR